DTWTLTVEDTGPGIAPQHLKSIFSEFERGPADTTVQGTGLGLDITQHLVELNGGSIRVESTTGQGSRFRATFPRSGRARNPATEGGAIR
ncbi:MAG: HAMP domain-containing sensor histidine kinase, partial [Candidatus Acidiferrum sp.]